MNYHTKRQSYLYLFDESNHSIIPTIHTFDRGTPIYLSRHKLTGFDDVIGKINRDHYVMCVVYFKHGVVQDTQLGITGTIMKKFRPVDPVVGTPPGLPPLPPLYEPLEFAAVREGAEELGLTFDKLNLLNKTYGRHPTKRFGQYQNVHTFTIDATCCEPYVPEEHAENVEFECTEKNGWHDDRSNKVQVIVHGELHKLQEIIEQIKHRIPSNDLTSIGGIRLMHQQDVYLGMKMLNSRR